MKKRILITGGAGFIGSNLAGHFLKEGYHVTIFDNFNRFGTRENALWLKRLYPEVKIVKGDIRKRNEIRREVIDKEIIFHLAAQVAVTTSVVNPGLDFDINALGTFHVMDTVREIGHKPIVIFSSTNKVYGGMENIKIVKRKKRYVYKDLPYGISEKENLDFHSPYGCSKGAADQYTRDYERVYDIPTVVFRQSCIYGPRQFGIEDQGWIAWFIIAVSYGKSITVYGDGMQVRDVLYIDDLIGLFEIAVKKINIARGKIYNVGGGMENTLSVWSEFGPILEELFGKTMKASFDCWRPGDQKVYISDIRLVEKELGWKPKIGVKEGITKLYHWVRENKELFRKLI